MVSFIQSSFAHVPFNRNTTHVVFKDGLQSTYNKAKSWNIPIVSILWIEACKKHLVLMNPSAYKIPDIEKYENPDLYEKTKVTHLEREKSKKLTMANVNRS